MSQTLHQPAGGEARISLYDEVTARVIAEMEQGIIPWVKPWKSSGVSLGLPRSAATRKAYSGINILILWDAVMTRGFTAQEWLTYRQALSLGGHVKPGERGTTACYADSFIPKAERERSREQGDDPNRIPFLKRFTLFNIEQCEGLPAHIAGAHQLDPVPITDPVPDADRAVDATGAAIRPGDQPKYVGKLDTIFMPAPGDFLTAADYYCTILHELGHWTAHPSRLARDLAHRFGSTAYAREELIAELTSAFLCAHFNIVPQVRHADYLANWLAVLKEDARAIFHAASQASKASDYILGLSAPIPAEQGRAA